MMMYENEQIQKVFDKYADVIRSRSLKWTHPRDSRWGDRRINRFIKYFCIPITLDEVIALLDTTVFRTAKEGCLFTYSGVFVKEVVEKLYYLEYAKIERAEVLEERDEYYNVETSLWVHFKDGTKRQIFDYYLNRQFFADFINDVVKIIGASK